MKILVVCQYYYPERIGLVDICEELVKRKHYITVLTGLPNYPEGKVPKEYKFFRRRNENLNGVKIKRCFEIGRRKGKLWLCINYVSFMISSIINVLFIGNKYEEIICYQHSPITMAIAAILYKKIHKKKLILYCFDLWPESLKTYDINENSAIFKILYKISNYVYKNCDKIIVSSKPFEDYFTSVHNIEKNKITYIPQHSTDFGISMKKKINEKVHFLFAGNIGKMQNIECIINAVNEIKKKAEFVVDIVGYGSNYDNLIQTTKSLGLENNIVFHGRKNQEQMKMYYDSADAMLLTLKGNNFVSKTLPLKLQSYMSTGKPIFAAIEGAASEIISDSKCGVCVKPDDYKALSNLMADYIENREKYDKLGENGRKYFIENFNFLASIDKLEKEL